VVGIASVDNAFGRVFWAATSDFLLMCYGGGFGTMPAFAADYFGSKNVGPIYGLMLTAWGCTSAFGPLLIAHLRQSTGSYSSGLRVIAGIMLVSIIGPILVRPPRPKTVSESVATAR
jgi:OFA family oxalate/formate antiporter-like MFS transporter